MYCCCCCWSSLLLLYIAFVQHYYIHLLKSTSNRKYHVWKHFYWNSWRHSDSMQHAIHTIAKKESKVTICRSIFDLYNNDINEIYWPIQLCWFITVIILKMPSVRFIWQDTFANISILELFILKSNHLWMNCAVPKNFIKDSFLVVRSSIYSVYQFLFQTVFVCVAVSFSFPFFFLFLHSLIENIQ